MSEKFRNKYRIPSARLQTWDYGSNGRYFITICTGKRNCYFGYIQSGVMHLSELGQIARKFWLEIPGHFPFVKLSEFVVMPNHVHGILIINKSYSHDRLVVGTRLIATLRESIDQPIIHSTDGPTNASSEQLPHCNPEKPGGFAGNKNPMFHNNISRIIRWYKGRCSFEIHKIDTDFAWQPLFHDHIIRDPGEFYQIRNYINNNPALWDNDKFNG